MHKCERYTDGSSIKPLKSGQTYEPYKTQGRWSEATFENCAYFQILYIQGLSMCILIHLA